MSNPAKVVLEPVSPNVTAENQYRDEDDQKIGGVHIVLPGYHSRLDPTPATFEV